MVGLEVWYYQTTGKVGLHVVIHLVVLELVSYTGSDTIHSSIHSVAVLLMSGSMTMQTISRLVHH